MSSINSGITPIGSNVTVKGTINSILLFFMGPHDQSVQISDGSGNLTFYWTRTRLAVGWIILVCGTVGRNNNLHPVSSIERVLLFP
jgi:hypothetical protein